MANHQCLLITGKVIWGGRATKISQPNTHNWISYFRRAAKISQPNNIATIKATSCLHTQTLGLSNAFISSIFPPLSSSFLSLKHNHPKNPTPFSSQSRKMLLPSNTLPVCASGCRWSRGGSFSTLGARVFGWLVKLVTSHPHTGRAYVAWPRVQWLRPMGVLSIASTSVGLAATTTVVFKILKTQW